MDRTEQVATLAGATADQWGLVTAAQAKTLGVNGVQLLRLTEAGLLASVGRGVYLLTAAGMPHHLETKVAWLRLQPKRFVWERSISDPDSGVISHTSACQLLELGDIPAPEVEISTPRRRTTTEPSVRLRTASIERTEITTVDGLPVTTALRTITDLLRIGADGGHVGGVIADAERRDLITVEELAQQVQPFVRKYGLKTNATGHDLITHLVAQAGERLRRQEVDQASQEGFDRAVSLIAEHPGLVELMRMQRAAQPSPQVVAAMLRATQPNPAVNEALRKLMQSTSAISAAMQPDPAVSEVLRRAMQPTLALGEVMRSNPAMGEALRKLMQSTSALGEVMRSNPAMGEALRKLMQSTSAISRTIQPDPAVSEVLRKAIQPDPAVSEVLRKAIQP
ncbi:type IV toxin-antitoxin system AbiEi family antitoxin domain-containing protein, partial [Streptomyces sp. NPDC056194]|uniref:type IV toxin-antitoxin system AbiEi family antitoxin domain-containing protein n=1 Tax=Streptomyces sp. NPDC056194 TaxID=3345744 RepID=UPI0035DD2ED6